MKKKCFKPEMKSVLRSDTVDGEIGEDETGELM